MGVSGAGESGVPVPASLALPSWGPREGPDFWASVSPKCKEGLLQSCGWEMLLVFGCIISDTCRERLSAQDWSAQRRSIFAGKFRHALDKEMRPLSGSVYQPQQWMMSGQGTRGWLGLEVYSFPAESVPTPPAPQVPRSLGTGLPPVWWWPGSVLGEIQMSTAITNFSYRDLVLSLVS